MVKDFDDKSQKIQKQFEEILPTLWDKAKANEAKLKTEYLSGLHTKLLEEIKSQISTPSFETWFSDLTIEDLTEDNTIIFGTNTNWVKEWLEQRYMRLIEQSLRTVTKSDFKAFVVLKELANNISKNEKPYTVEHCVICNCRDIQSKDIEIPLGIQGVVNMTVEGFVCRVCDNKYYSERIKRINQSN
jgi:chromosomal replication initiation ATPase DnaA